MRRVILSLLVSAIVGVAFVAVATAGRDASREATRVVALETAIVRQVNDERTANGLRPLTISPDLTRASLAHSLSMVELGFFSHTSMDGTSFSDRIKLYYASRGRWTVGENLAMFGGPAPTAAQVVDAWLRSRPHRANLLRPTFREVGVAVIRSSEGIGRFAGMTTWVVTADLGARGNVG